MLKTKKIRGIEHENADKQSEKTPDSLKNGADIRETPLEKKTSNKNILEALLAIERDVFEKARKKNII